MSETADFLNDLYGGAHDAALAAMNIEESKDPSQVDWTTVRGLELYGNIVRLFRSAGTAVSSSAAGDAPAPNKRTLNRLMPDPAYEDARHDEVQRERPAGLFDVAARGHPFSWTERKPLSWYEVFLSEVRAALVVDYSPGSGAMARACLNQGIQYVGICRTDQHCSWLTNILNKAAVEP